MPRNFVGLHTYNWKQDQVNNANSAFILINCWISQGFQSGSIGPGGPGGPDSLGCPGVPDGQGGRGGRVVGRSEGQAVRWSRLSGGRAVEVFMMAGVVQVVQTVSAVPLIQVWLVRVLQVVRW